MKRRIFSMLLVLTVLFSLSGLAASFGTAEAGLAGNGRLEMVLSKDTTDGIIKAAVSLYGEINGLTGIQSAIRYDNSVFDLVMANDKTTVVTPAKDKADYIEDTCTKVEVGGDEWLRFAAGRIIQGYGYASIGYQRASDKITPLEFEADESDGVANYYFKIKNDTEITAENVASYFAFNADPKAWSVITFGATNVRPSDLAEAFPIIVDEESFGGGEPEPVPVTSITITGAPTGEIEKGATGQLGVTVEPSNATDSSVTWASDNTDAVTVDGSGNYSAVGVGSAKITATANDGSGVVGEVTITVKDSTPAASIDKVEISLDPTTIAVGEKSKATVTVTKTGEIDDSYTLSADPAGAVTFSGDEITAVTAGSVTITATSVADGTKSANATLTINAATVNVTAVKLNKTEATVVGGETVDLEATVEPENATNKTVIWSTSDDTVATVADGVVTTKEVEETKTVTITATSAANDRAKAECVITVNPKPAAGPEKAEIVVQKESGAQVSTNTIIGSDPVQLVLIVDKGEVDVTWTVSSGDAATIAPDTGILTIVKSGDITVTATEAVTTAGDITGGSVSADFTIYAAGEQAVYLDAPVVELEDTVTDTTFNVTLKGQLTEAYPTKATISYDTAKLTATAVAAGSSTSVGTIDDAAGTINLVNLQGTDDVVITFKVDDATITAGDSTNLTLSDVEATTIDTPSNTVSVEVTETTPVVFVAEAPMAVEKLYTVDASATKAGGTPLYGLKITADEGYDIKVKDSTDADKQAYWIASEEAYVVLVDVDYSLTGLAADDYTKTESETVPSVVIGDVNADNTVSAADALEVAKYMIGLNDDITDAEFIAANINLVYGTGAATPVGADDANLQDIGVIMDMATTVEP